MTLNAKRRKRYREKNLHLLQVNCLFCNKSFEANRVGTKYCSSKCRIEGLKLLPKDRVKRKRNPSVAKNVLCIKCGLGMKTTSSNLKYCDKCREEKRKETQKSRVLKKRALKRPEEGAYCQICNKFFGQVHLNTKYCKKCSTEKEKEIKSLWQNEKFPKVYPKERECKNCGKIFDATCAKNKCCSDECKKENRRKTNNEWRSNNKDHYQLLDSKRRERVYQAGSFKKVSKEYSERLDEIGGCVYCNSKEDLTIDHLIPLSKGGKNEINNLFPACLSCNCSKNDSNWLEWYHKKDFFSVDRMCKIVELYNA